MGIPSEDIERIFESFVQGPQNGQSCSGLGVGLHLCKHIVQMHKGMISANSDGVGCGSRSTVTLPIATVNLGLST